MKPPPFDYHVPTSREEAVSLLSETDLDVKVLSGGQSLLSLMNLRLVRPDALVDIGGLSELRYINDGESVIAIGATTTHADVERSPALASAVPMLRVAARHIGHPAIRTRGTVGGSLAHADPSAEWPAVMALLDAAIHLESERAGVRTVPSREFFTAFLTTQMEPDELLTRIEIPLRLPNERWSFHQFARQPGAFAIVTGAAVASIATDGTTTAMSVAVGGCDQKPRIFSDGQIPAVGSALSDGAIKATAESIVRDLKPVNDVHATAEDRQQIAGILIQRTLQDISSQDRRRGRGEQ